MNVFGKCVNFGLDSAKSFRMSATSGETNNNPSPNIPFNVTTTPADGFFELWQIESTQNVGMFTRCQKNAIVIGNSTGVGADPVINGTAGNGFTTLGAIGYERHSVANTNPITLADGFSQVLSWNFWIQLPMRYVHDFFDKMPINRAGLWQLVMTTHLPSTFTATVDMTTITAGKTTQWTPTSAFNQHGFTPFMIAAPGVPIAASRGISGISMTAGGGLTLVTCTCNIGFSNLLGGPSIANNNGQLTTMHCTTYKLEKTVEDAYMANPKKRVVFEDFTRALPIGLTNVPFNQQVQVNITPGTGKLRYMLILPFLPAISGGNGAVNPPCSSLTSALTSAGATATPYYFLDNFQVQVAGVNLYPQNFQYTYDYFRQEVLGWGAPNGNAVDGMRAGLFDEDGWNGGYGFIVVNLSRHLPSADDLPVSIDLSFTNMSVNTMSFQTFLVFEKDFVSKRAFIYYAMSILLNFSFTDFRLHHRKSRSLKPLLHVLEVFFFASHFFCKFC